MVLIGGPRQCGKTTLSKAILSNSKSQGLYLNWDATADRKRIREMKWSKDDRLLVLDEIHKMPKWKTWLKGLYDTQNLEHKFLVTGSARMDVYKRGGDSMFGRHHYWRLHPFCLAERPTEIKANEAFRRLMEVGGFPEPFLSNSPVEAKRWRRERSQLVLREDVRDLEKISDIVSLDLLLESLKSRVSGQIVMANLAEDFEVAPQTIQKWIDICCRMYLTFAVRPYSKSILRAHKKAPRIYFYDNADVDGNEGQRFENLVASHLLKRIQFLEDSTGDRYELNYLRDKEKREIDFVVLKNGKVSTLIEAKWSNDTPPSALYFYREKLKAKRALVLVAELDRKFEKSGIEVWPAIDWLAQNLEADIF